MVEVLICIFILLLLYALLLPVLSQGRRRAFASDTLGRMRQLGQAATLYEEANGAWPTGASVLVEAGLAPAILCQATNDPTSGGFGNQLLSSQGAGEFVTTYKNSFIGWREYQLGDEYISKWILDGEGGGWLVDVSVAEQGPTTDPITWNGVYRRLHFDTSVRSYKFRDVDCTADGKDMPCRMSILLFVEPDQEMLKWIKDL